MRQGAQHEVAWRPPPNGRLGFQIRRDSPIDVEAFASRIVAVIGRVRV
jgi:hypothetical protein